MELMPSNGLVSSIAANLISNMIWIVIISVFSIIGLQFKLRKLRYIIFYTFWGKTIFFGFICYAASDIIFRFGSFQLSIDPSYSIFLFLFTIYLFVSLLSFSRYGIFSVQRKVETGTSYEDALSLCQNSLWFLGTGAYKLTSKQNFEETIRRCCTQNGAVRLLLSTPTNALLSKSAANAAAAPSKYANNVKASLVILSRLRIEREFDFEVRFYDPCHVSKVQDFRIFIIDRRIALVSHNKYGSPGEGKDEPQLVLSSDSPAGGNSFYVPFEQYFMHLWEASKEWDFKEYI
jgi:hypothetical protein